MFKGTVSFVAKIGGDGITFPLFEFNPNEQGVNKVEITGTNGAEIRTSVHLASVATQDDGRTLATKVHTAALNRIAFFHGVVIETARSSADEFFPVNAHPGVHATSVSEHLVITDTDRAVVSISAAHLKTELEKASPSGERHYGLFRSACQSVGSVERFMHLYNILLMLCNDKQRAVNDFIVCEDPSVPQSQHPQNNAVMETVYSRLRNEMAHPRPGVNLGTTKAEMANRIGGLVALTKRGIEVHP